MTANVRVMKLLKGRRTSDGAGVKLTRMFSRYEVTLLDPFLLLDLFGSNQVEDYIAGFPLHPHRGIETVTYMRDGYVDHQDSLGNKGTIGPGDVQWMTAGSGILHKEMPRKADGWLRGFQLWVNLPKASKMIAPRYRGIERDGIPQVDLDHGSSAKVIAGTFKGVKGPIKDLMVEVEFLDLTLAPKAKMQHQVPEHMNTFIMVFEGSVTFIDDKEVVSERAAILSNDGTVSVVAGDKGAKFLLVSGKPLNEPMAWGGPIVMNTEAELEEAFLELEKGTFIKKDSKKARPKT